MTLATLDAQAIAQSQLNLYIQQQSENTAQYEIDSTIAALRGSVGLLSEIAQGNYLKYLKLREPV
ncbi:hypothetical protein [Nostoc sp. WHI]|uniref:hypothetical protein n=1 Tax=Nostoc sp. WHI TaxID=2650611 RepID=UPI0018C57F98|nr:hypothetical protein [Nostoc sp. WHI]MBG1270682.1 hypothetical protein [Nostoc sp. WHI]